MLNQRFGRWLVLSQATTGRTAKWNCICDCGVKRAVWGVDLRRGRSLSCGCYNRERIINANTTHGAATTRLGRIWTAMKRRCNNPDSQAYKNYGGRGISVCKEWSNYSVFKLWAEKNGYEANLTIERINNDLGYSPENCAWIPLSEQSRNRRVCYTDSDGILWLDKARNCGLAASTFHARLRNWLTLKDAAFLPSQLNGLLNVRQTFKAEANELRRI